MKSTRHTVPILLLATLCAAFAPSGVRGAATDKGPTPYPDAKDESAWPGRGPIRVFDWVETYRKKFWAQREADQGKIVFVGDSIIGGWKLENDFSGKPVTNRGIGGDVTRGVLFRLQEDVLDLHPKAIVIHIGCNDITADAMPETVMSNYNAILDLIEKANPGLPVVVLAVLPHGIPTGEKAPSPQLTEYLKKVNARIPLLNAELAKLPTARKNVVYVDSYTLFLLADGSLDLSQFSDDRVHPNDAGHSKLGKLVEKALTDLKLL